MSRVRRLQPSIQSPQLAHRNISPTLVVISAWFAANVHTFCVRRSRENYKTVQHTCAHRLNFGCEVSNATAFVGIYIFVTTIHAIAFTSTTSDRASSPRPQRSLTSQLQRTRMRGSDSGVVYDGSLNRVSSSPPRHSLRAN
jgi:hypothetical protein